jgi:hypothetical protein
MLGKVDELAVNADTFYTFNLGDKLRLLMDLYGLVRLKN